MSYFSAVKGFLVCHLLQIWLVTSSDYIWRGHLDQKSVIQNSTLIYLEFIKRCFYMIAIISAINNSGSYIHNILLIDQSIIKWPLYLVSINIHRLSLISNKTLQGFCKYPAKLLRKYNLYQNMRNICCMELCLLLLILYYYTTTKGSGAMLELLCPITYQSNAFCH